MHRIYMTLIASVVLANLSLAEEAEMRWWKGNTHTHSLWSDGDMAPELIAQWYLDQGFDFLCFSEHNTLQEGDRFISIKEGTKLSPERVAPIREKFGEDWLVIDESEANPRMKLKTHEELTAHFNKPGEFLLIQAEEITTLGGVPHVNAINLVEAIRGRPGDVEALLYQYLKEVKEQEERTGRPIVAHVNHLNFAQGIKVEQLLHVPLLDFFEVYNGHPAVDQWGKADEGVPDNDRIWDIVQSVRMVEDPDFLLYGVGTDDAHEYWEWAPDKSNPGRGYIMVRAPELSANALVEAMKRGDFYATTGVTLSEIEATRDKLRVKVAPEDGVNYTIRFIGTKKGFDTTSTPVTGPDGQPPARASRLYSDSIGKTLQEDRAAEATYTFTGEELYVRARVISDRPVERPVEAHETEQAWVQPVIVSK